MQEQMVRFTVDCILDAAKEAGVLGAPSGVIYAVLSQYGMSLTVYQQIVDAMVSQGLVKVDNHCIKFVEQAK